MPTINDDHIQRGSDIPADDRIAFDITDDGLTDLVRTALAHAVTHRLNPADFIVRLDNHRDPYVVGSANLIAGHYIARDT